MYVYIVIIWFLNYGNPNWVQQQPIFFGGWWVEGVACPVLGLV